MALVLERDRPFLNWLFSQFVYGEVTGIQCGYWLMRAPTLEAATFLARQSVEELSHVKRMHRILLALSECVPVEEFKIEPVHPVIWFLSTGMMSKDWAHHVTLEMALGEGMVLEIFQVLHQEIPHLEIQTILNSAIPEETRHAEFGRREAMQWLHRFPSDRRWLRTHAWMQWIALKVLQRWMRRSWIPKVHVELGEIMMQAMDRVLRRYQNDCTEIGLQMEWKSGMKRVFQIGAGILMMPFDQMRLRRHRPKPLTSTYRDDPWLGARPSGSTNSTPIAY